MDNKEKILVVDDDPIILESLRRLLEKRGYGVEAASTAADALRVLEAKRCDLVLTDLSMPGMDGMALLRRIKEQSPHIPVVMLTAYASTETVIQALREGVNDFLTKPAKVNELLGIVEREIRRHKQAQPAGMDSGLGRQLSAQQLEEIDRALARLRAEISARCLLLVEGNGYIISSKGYIEDVNMSALAALVAGDFAATSGIASLIGEDSSFRLNYHEGEHYNAYSAQVREDVFLLIVFEQTVKLGAVLYYAKQALPELQAVIEQPPAPPDRAGATPSPDGGLSPAEIRDSGLLEQDSLGNLDRQFADLWKKPPG
ncbi:MAG: response regulator [Chloroflexia bacterium]|nr:response regulator [Chloroflexia bacterium]